MHGGQAKVDALLALSQRTLHVPRKVDGSDGFATLVNENGDWALPVFTSQEQLVAAADVFGWRRQDRTVLAEEVGARRVVHYALNEGARAFMVIDAVAPHALEATREETEAAGQHPEPQRHLRAVCRGGAHPSSILGATRPDAERRSQPCRPGAAHHAPARGAGHHAAVPSARHPCVLRPAARRWWPAQRRPTVSFARSSRPPPPWRCAAGAARGRPMVRFELDLPQPPPVARSSQRPRQGRTRPPWI
ncbi:MAG: hypothetical protein IPG81_26265 [Sandaracinaceae bacterium]|nr:hypothetical protein [Sandaracinaceae bacterium]